MNYYNEYDRHAAAWLRELMRDKLIPEGEVDGRSIADVQPEELRGFTQCHFFAGIGGWSRSLRLAGLPDDLRVWTGSCPCQSFSVAGEQLGFADEERHLWPQFFRLIAAERPSLIFGEQVDAAVTVGDTIGNTDQSWLDLVSSDLGKAGYEVGAAVLPALYVGAPHKRNRLYFVAHTSGLRGSSATDNPYRASDVAGFWSDVEEPKPRVRPVVDGLPERVGEVRGAGNAIVPQQAAEFIQAYFEACQIGQF